MALENIQETQSWEPTETAKDDVQEPIFREHSSYVRVLGNGKGKISPSQYSQGLDS